MADTEKLTFDELITHWAQEKPDQTALEQDGEAISFADLEERSRRVVAMLRTRAEGGSAQPTARRPRWWRRG